MSENIIVFFLLVAAVNVKVKQGFPYTRPWRPIELVDVEALILSTHSAHRRR
jgi:hypothetical protein